MANRPRFRRKLRSTPDTADDDLRPVPPLERPAERRAREDAETEAHAAEAAEQDRLRAEAEARARAEEERRRAEAEARARAEDDRRRAEAEAEARADAQRQEAEARERTAAPPPETDRMPDDHPAAPAVHPDMDDSARLWDAMPSFPVDERLLDQNRVITASRHDPAHASFDVLRTRLLSALNDREWSRVAVTSPTKGCGKTFTAANLGISLARQANLRTVVLDLDLRNPSLHKVFGVDAPGSIGDMLRGRIAPEAHLRRLGPNSFHAGRNIAFGFNDAVEPYSAELLQDPRTGRALDALEEALEPDVIILDLPPALAGDDVLALRPRFDGLLLVAGGGITTQSEIREVENRLGDGVPLLGVVLNRAEGISERRYAY